MMVNALLMCAAAGFGFGSSPWIGFAIGASMIVLLSVPEQREVLSRYRGQPKTIFVILLYLGLVTGGAFVSAWLGYFLVLLLRA
jgi:hypothetical protein